MKFLHTADLHIGSTKRLLPDEYLKRQDTSLLKIFEIGKKEKVHLLLIAGDIYENCAPTREESDVFLKHVLLWDSHFTTIIIPGNHDYGHSYLAYNNERGYTSINNLKILEREKRLKNTHICLKPKILNIAEGIVIAIPYPYNTEKVLKKVPKSVIDKAAFVYVVLHDDIAGSLRDNNMRVKKGLQVKSFDWVDYFACGHIHKYQKLATNLAYSGSPIQHNFGEELKKGVIIGNADAIEFKEIQDVAKLYTVQTGEQIPSDGYVRLITNGENEDTNNADNIVMVRNIIKEETVIQTKERDITYGLTLFLAKEGLNELEQKRSLRLVKKLL